MLVRIVNPGLVFFFSVCIDSVFFSLYLLGALSEFLKAKRMVSKVISLLASCFPNRHSNFI